MRSSSKPSSPAICARQPLQDYVAQNRAALDTTRYASIYIHAMTPKRLRSFYLDPELSEAMKILKDRDGIAEAEQVRRALKEWLERKGVLKKPVKK